MHVGLSEGTLGDRIEGTIGRSISLAVEARFSLTGHRALC